MTTNTHKHIRGTFQEYEEATATQTTSSAEIRGMPTHPRQLSQTVNGRSLPPVMDNKHLYDISNHVRQFDMSKASDVEEYERLMDDIFASPLTRNNKQVHFQLRQEETNFFAGKYGVLVKWLECVFDPDKMRQANLHMMDDLGTRRRDDARPTYVEEYTPERARASVEAFGIQVDPPAKKDAKLGGVIED